MIDLRFLGATLPQRDVAELAREILPWTWGAFALAVVTGSLLFVSAATRYFHIPYPAAETKISAHGSRWAQYADFPFTALSSSSRVGGAREACLLPRTSRRSFSYPLDRCRRVWTLDRLRIGVEDVHRCSSRLTETPVVNQEPEGRNARSASLLPPHLLWVPELHMALFANFVQFRGRGTQLASVMRGRGLDHLV